MKRLYIIVLSALFLAAAPIAAFAQVDEELTTEINAATMVVRDGNVHITNAEGKNLEVYNVTGVRVALIRIDSNDKQVNLNLSRGCYILKVGKIVRKITIL